MSTPARPDPDALLAQLHHDEARQRQGRLRIFFGAAAGVGKTTAMLLAAHQALAAGTDVVSGIVETYGRADTAALLKGLTLLPRASLKSRNTAGEPLTTFTPTESALTEFDLDAALLRNPALILVDELAHSNVAGSRHAKRWQDIDELLAADIDVYSTLNVQHLESLNDLVGGITGIVVRETVPDTFFDRADEVVLIDTPADELLVRLQAGKVYLPAQVERASRNFFRKGNLMALRELALRRVADRVGVDVQAYRSERAIAPVWRTDAAILCCMGDDERAADVVRNAAQRARQSAVGWHAVVVETPALQRLPDRQRAQVFQTVKLAADLGAETAVLSAERPATALVSYARQHNLSTMLMGRSRRADGWRSRWPGRTLGQAVSALAPDIDRIEIGQALRSRRLERGPQPTPASVQQDTASRLLSTQRSRYLLAAAACALTTVLTHLLVPYFDAANIVMVFLLAVVGVAMSLGRGPAVLAAFLNVAAFDFFFVAPRLSFAVADVQYILTFDEREIRQFVRTALQDEGFGVCEAGSLKQGLVEAATRRPDLAIVDLGLPDGDGVELIREVRGWSGMPIIVLSARADERDKVVALDAGADDFITKPFGVAELLARTRAHLRRLAHGSTDADSVFQFGDVRVDRGARTVHRRGVQVHLTPLEYRLLGVLMANCGRVLTHPYLLREVWGPGHGSVGTGSRWPQPLPAGVHGQFAHEAGRRSGATQTPDHRDRRGLSTDRRSVNGVGSLSTKQEPSDPVPSNVNDSV